MHAPHPFDRLSPFLVVDAVSALGLEPDGRISALSSYENRVYALPQEDGAQSLVAKFYRPGRWSPSQIQEEHDFALALLQDEVPMVAPLVLKGQTLHALSLSQSDHSSMPEGFEGFEGERNDPSSVAKHNAPRSPDPASASSGADAVDFWFSVSPSRGGRMPELDDWEVLEWLGRFIGRLHTVGQVSPFTFRPSLDVQSQGWGPRAYLLNEFEIAPAYKGEWAQLTKQALEAVEKAFDFDFKKIRLHGDCHAGNILWTPLDKNGQGGPHFVDLDDARMGPAVQDLWMLMGAGREEQTLSMSVLLEGYEQVREFDRRELALIEPLRTLRMIHYSAWLAQRLGDPAFVRHFSWFASEAYWQEQVIALADQIERMQEPVLLV